MIMCARCHHPVDSAIHVRDSRGTWIDVTCHGVMLRMADTGNEGLAVLAFT